MNLAKYSPKAQTVFVESQKIARARQHQGIEPEHLLFALASTARSKAGRQHDLACETTSIHLTPASLAKIIVRTKHIIDEKRFEGNLVFLRARGPASLLDRYRRFREKYDCDTLTVV